MCSQVCSCFQKQLAALFASLGVISSALDIYLRVHMWEDAIVCLIRTGRGHEAEKVIREQLAIKETANLYCLLGDLLQVSLFVCYREHVCVLNDFKAVSGESITLYVPPPYLKLN